MDDFTLNFSDQAAVKKLIESLDEDDLRFLNKTVVSRLKALDAARDMADFSMGDTVSFIGEFKLPVDAVIVKFNKKTVGVISEAGDRYNVSPSSLKLVKAREKTDTRSPAAVGSIQDQRIKKSKIPVRDTEWVGGVVHPPTYVMDQDDPYVPEIFSWLDSDEFIIGSALGEPTLTPLQIKESLQTAISRPMVGSPAVPSRIRVDNDALVEILAPQFPMITFSSGPTPEIDGFEEKMREDMLEGVGPPSMLDTALPSGAIASFFKAAAELYKAKPWDFVPHDECLFSVTIEHLDISNGVLCVIGQQGESFGLIFFENIAHYEQYRLMIEQIHTTGVPDVVPLHTALSYDNGAELDPELRKEISTNGWEVAGAQAYPSLFSPGPDKMLRPLFQADYTLFECLCRALVQCSRKKQPWVKAWSGRSTHSKLIKADTFTGEIEISLVAPFPYRLVLAEHPDTVIADLTQIARLSGEPDDWDEHHDLTDSLKQCYENSPEGKLVGKGLPASELVVDFAYNYLGVTIATLPASLLEEILFEIIPRKVMVGAEDAEFIIKECRQFFLFLKRRYALAQADACLEVLSDDAIARLASALSDTNNFGIGKSALSPGSDFGLDTGLLPGGMHDLFDPEFPALPKSTSKKTDPAARKKQRKAARKARKKNR